MKHYTSLPRHAYSVVAVVVTPDGRYALSGSFDGTVKVWDLARGMEEKTLTGHSKPVRAVAVSPDGRYALSASDDHTIKVWDIARGVEEKTLTGHTDSVHAVIVTPDGQRVISASCDRTIKSWDLARGVEVKTVSLLNFDTAQAVVMTPDGQRLLILVSQMPNLGELAQVQEGKLSYPADKYEIRVVNVMQGIEERALIGHFAPVIGVAVTPDGQRALSASSDHTIKVWDLAKGIEERTLAGHSDSVHAVTVTPDGQRVISASSDRTIKVWDWESGLVLADFLADSSLESCAISPDGSTIVVGEESGRVHFLRLENVP